MLWIGVPGAGIKVEEFGRRTFAFPTSQNSTRLQTQPTVSINGVKVCGIRVYGLLVRAVAFVAFGQALFPLEQPHSLQSMGLLSHIRQSRPDYGLEIRKISSTLFPLRSGTVAVFEIRV